MQLQWVGREAEKHIVETRLRCYSPTPGDRERYIKHLRADPRPGKKDFLLGRVDGEVVGTVTNMNLTMRLRGADLPCQGIAWVGTIRTHRRSNASRGQGIASQLMFEALKKAREQEQCLSALMPFRNSFYEHFGFGQAETRSEWIIPTPVLPSGDTSGIRFYRDSDFPKLCKLRQREFENGHGDVLTDRATMKFWLGVHSNGWRFVDVDKNGQLKSFFFLADEMSGNVRYARVDDWCCASLDDFVKILRFLASQKDQYNNAVIITPVDWPINRVLRESQIPHRPVAHSVASMTNHTRMQIRVLDHKKTLEAMSLPALSDGIVHLAVHESEGHVSKLKLELQSGRFRVRPSTSNPDLNCKDHLWASIVAGEIKATDAIRLGLADGDIRRAELLDGFCFGRRPFCQDYF